MFDDFAIRLAGPENAADVTAVLTASYGELWRGHYRDAELDVVLPKITQAQPRLLASGRFYLACDGAAIAGCGGWSHEPPAKTGKTIAGTGHLRHFGVHPDHLRKGVGRALYRACAGQARIEGVKHFEALSSLQAVPFYQRLGFRLIEQFEIELADGIRLTAMRMAAELG
jgi:GNAT superfamily N-acetyltransferase